jgi:hypothetical protein
MNHNNSNINSKSPVSSDYQLNNFPNCQHPRSKVQEFCSEKNHSSTPSQDNKENDFYSVKINHFCNNNKAKFKSCDSKRKCVKKNVTRMPDLCTTKMASKENCPGCMHPALKFNKAVSNDSLKDYVDTDRSGVTNHKYRLKQELLFKIKFEDPILVFPHIYSGSLIRYAKLTNSSYTDVQICLLLYTNGFNNLYSLYMLFIILF